MTGADDAGLWANVDKGRHVGSQNELYRNLHPKGQIGPGNTVDHATSITICGKELVSLNLLDLRLDQRILKPLNDRIMLRDCCRRICISFVAVALIFSLPMYRMPGGDLMQQLAFAETTNGHSCTDCGCCENDGNVEFSTCMILCAGMVASLPDDKISDVTATPMLYSEEVHQAVDVTTAPELRPPR